MLPAEVRDRVCRFHCSSFVVRFPVYQVFDTATVFDIVGVRQEESKGNPRPEFPKNRATRGHWLKTVLQETTFLLLKTVAPVKSAAPRMGPEAGAGNKTPYAEGRGS